MIRLKYPGFFGSSFCCSPRRECCIGYTDLYARVIRDGPIWLPGLATWGSELGRTDFGFQPAFQPQLLWLAATFRSFRAAAVRRRFQASRRIHRLALQAAPMK